MLKKMLYSKRKSARGFYEDDNENDGVRDYVD